jgi:hypothetical protein
LADTHILVLDQLEQGHFVFTTENKSWAVKTD